MTFKKYIVDFVVLPYFTFAKQFIKKSSPLYMFMLILNAIWILFLLIAVSIGIITTLI